MGRSRRIARLTLAALVGVGAALTQATPAEAFQFFFGWDDSTTTPLRPGAGGDTDDKQRTPLVNSANAEVRFTNELNSFVGLGNVATSGFDVGFTNGQTGPFNNVPFIGLDAVTFVTEADFTVQSGTITAVRVPCTPGPSGPGCTPSPNDTDGNGRYPISTEFFLEVPAGTTTANSFTIEFINPLLVPGGSKGVGAVGGYLVDIGDFGGTLTVQFDIDFADGSPSQTFSIPFNGTPLPASLCVASPTVTCDTPNIPPGSLGSTSGNVAFFGVILDDTDQYIDQIRFLTSDPGGGTVDNFAFDNFYVAQVPAPPPVAGGLLLMGVLGKLRKRYRNVCN